MFFECSREWENAYIYRHDDLYFRSNPTLYVMYGPQIMAEFYGKNHDGKPKKGAQEWPSHQVKWTLKRSQARPLWLTNPPRPLTCTPMPTLWWPYGPPTGPCKYPSPSPKTSFTLLPLIARPLQVARNPSFKYLSLHVAGWWCLGRLQHTEKKTYILEDQFKVQIPPPPIQKIYIII